MAYDGYGRHSTLASARADSEIVLARGELNADRLILGIPFYGRIYNPDSEEYWTGTMNYRDILEEFSPDAGDDEAGDYFFNGPRTVSEKVYWARKKGLGGIFVWEVFYDSVGSGSLVEAVLAAAEAPLLSDVGE